MFDRFGTADLKAYSQDDVYYISLQMSIMNIYTPFSLNEPYTVN